MSFRKIADLFPESLELLFDAVDDVLDVVFLLMAAIKSYNFKSAAFATNGHILAHYVRHKV